MSELRVRYRLVKHQRRCSTAKALRKLAEFGIENNRDAAETAMACLNEGFESSMTVMSLPAGLQNTVHQITLSV